MVYRLALLIVLVCGIEFNSGRVYVPIQESEINSALLVRAGVMAGVIDLFLLMARSLGGRMVDLTWDHIAGINLKIAQLNLGLSTSQRATDALAKGYIARNIELQEDL